MNFICGLGCQSGLMTRILQFLNTLGGIGFGVDVYLSFLFSVSPVLNF